MSKKFMIIFALLAVVITACSAQPAEPTLSPEEVQGTAVSAAFTMVAQTQAAIPTATSLPPTETPSPTPLPTFTPLPSPTPDLTIIPTVTAAPTTSSSGGGTCSGILNMAEAGPRSNVRLENITDGTAAVSLFMYTPNSFGQCGSLAINPVVLKANANSTLSLPKGNYYAYAWITYKDGYQASGEGYFINKIGDDHLFPVKVDEDVIFSK